MTRSAPLRVGAVAIAFLGFSIASFAVIASDSRKKLERAIVEQVNTEREKQSLAPLRVDKKVAQLAREHSEAMAKGRRQFGHRGFKKRAQKIAKLGGEASAENVAANLGLEEPAREAVWGWMESPGHRNNLLGDFTITGAGAAQGADGTWYFTQLYARVTD